MMGDLTRRLASQQVDDRLRAARRCRAAKIGRGAPVRRLEPDARRSGARVTR